MQPDGRGWLFVPSGLVDGPLPTHYEPREGPYDNALYGQRSNPARQQFPRRYNECNRNDESYPYVVTTYRLTDHHTAGAMSRTLPYLSELQPEMFCEVSPALARERGLEHPGVRGGPEVIK
jgi:formate dehydrogenase major subunit